MRLPQGVYPLVTTRGRRQMMAPRPVGQALAGARGRCVGGDTSSRNVHESGRLGS